MPRAFINTETLIYQIGGQRVAAVVPIVPDSAPHNVREGIIRRRLIMSTGKCPCGAGMTLPSREERRRAHKAGQIAVGITCEHEDDCPAADEALIAALQAWRQ